MKLENSEILAAIPAFKELIQLQLPVQASYRVARLARAVEEAAKDIESTRASVLERYVERDAAGNPTPVIVDGEERQGHVNITDPARFTGEIEALLAIETEIAVSPIRVSEFGEAVSLSPAVLLGLGPLLVDDSPAEVA